MPPVPKHNDRLFQSRRRNSSLVSIQVCQPSRAMTETTNAPTEMRTAMKFGVVFRYSMIVPGAQLPSVENPNSLNDSQHTLQTCLPP